VTNEPALQTSDTHPDVVRLAQAVAAVRQQPAILAAAQGSSDARHYAAVGIPGVEFGPIGGGIASDAEWTSIPDLAIYAQVLQTFLQTLR
jgi:succinyl-diaminopimelate desuccinylase